MADDEVFFGADGFVGSETFGDQEAVGSDAQACMMMKPAPTSAFVVTQAQLLLEVLVVALDAPAHVCLRHQIVQGGVCRQIRKIIFERLGVCRGPLDQQPLLRVQARLADVSSGMAYTQGSEPSAERFIGALAPADRLKYAGRKTLGQVLDRYRLASALATG